jgi:hypothetical protein
MKTNYLKKISVLLLSASVLVSCMNPDNDTTSIQNVDEVVNESMKTDVVDAISNNTDDLVENFLNPKAKVSGMKKVVAMPSVKRITEEGVYPAEYVIDFGDWGYTDAVGRVYQGIVYKTVMDKDKSEVNYYAKEFYLNKNRVVFKKTVTNDIKERKYLTIDLWEYIEYSNGEVSEKNWNRTRTLVDTGKDEKRLERQYL